MNYSTQQDLIDRYGEDELIQLTDEQGLGVIDATKVMRAIEDATATIDGYLAGRYQTPLATVPAIVNRLACDMVRYFLHENGCSDHIETRYKAAVAFLKSVSKGEVQLGLSTGDQETVQSDGAEMVSDGRVFGRSSSRGFI